MDARYRPFRQAIRNGDVRIAATNAAYGVHALPGRRRQKGVMHELDETELDQAQLWERHSVKLVR